MKAEVSNSSNVRITQTIIEVNPIKGLKAFFVSLISLISDTKSLKTDQYGLISCEGLSALSFWIYGNLVNWLFFFLATLFKQHFTLYFIVIFIGYSLIATLIASLPWIVGWIFLRDKKEFLSFKETISIYLIYAGLSAVSLSVLNFYAIMTIDYSVFIKDVPNYMQNLAKDWYLAVIYRVLKYLPFFYTQYLVYQVVKQKNNNKDYSLSKTIMFFFNVMVLGFWFQTFIMSNLKIQTWVQEAFKTATLK